jgi:two-component system sensor histidine kinase/response regulator
LTPAPASQRLSRNIAPSLLAVALVAAAAGVNYLLQTAIGPAYSGYAAPFLVAIVIAARSGYVPGLLACALCFPVGHTLFGGELGWRGVDPARVIMGFFVAVLVSRMTAAKKTTARQNEIIAEQNRKLSRAVEDLQRKTEDVSAAHAALHAVLNAATQTGIVGVDTQGTITLFNAGAEALLGRRAADVVGTTLFTTFLVGEAAGTGTESLRPVDFASLVPPVEGRPSTGRDFILARPDGARLIANISLTAQREGGADSRVSGYVAVIHDITELRRNEAATVEAMRAAEAAAQTQSVFLTTMSHEIRTPLNGIVGMTGLLLETPLLPEQAEFAATIQNSSETLLAIVNEVLDFSKIEAGKLTLEEVDFDLYDVVEECAEMIAAGAHGKGIELVLPARPADAALVRGDRGRLRQILLNLLSNAVKFTPAGEVVTTVALRPAGEKGLFAKVTVTDTGIGIPIDAQDLLFRPFTQADASTTRRYGGTGLGLAISKRLVELMGGEIGVSSEPGHGAVFWFTARLGLAEPSRPPDGELSGKRLLVVDDNATNRRVLQLQLERHGCHVRLAQDAAEALDLLTQSPAAFDAVLTDRCMPETDGLALAAAIRRAPATLNLPILLLGSQLDSREATAGAGLNEVLVKPVRESQLIRALHRVFDGHAAPDSREQRQAARDKTAMGGSGSILVVEDNLVNQRVVSLMLDRLGYSPEVVSSGADALQALESRAYRVILMDCQMPEMDGFEATRAIRSRAWDARRTPIIALTANAMPGEREKCIAAGMNDYLAKPLTMDMLSDKLREWSA